jgi:phage protein, HK97 gp10 family
MFNFSLNSSFKNLEQSLSTDLTLLEERQKQIAQILAEQIKQEIKDILDIPVSKNGAKIVRSQPLQAPRKESGNLQNSVDYVLEQNGLNISIKVFCSNSAPYALYLEYGTQKTAARPFMLPTLNKYALILKEEIKEIGKTL